MTTPFRSVPSAPPGADSRRRRRRPALAGVAVLAVLLPAVVLPSTARAAGRGPAPSRAELTSIAQAAWTRYATRTLRGVAAGPGPKAAAAARALAAADDGTTPTLPDITTLMQDRATSTAPASSGSALAGFFGTEGNDPVCGRYFINWGMAGADIMCGVEPGDPQPGHGYVSLLVSGQPTTFWEAFTPNNDHGAHYLLGDARSVYYRGDANDFAVIWPFRPEAGDKVQLHGRAADYTVVPVLLPLPGAAIYRAGTTDLIGYVLGFFDINRDAIFAEPTPATPALAAGGVQWGSAGIDVGQNVARDADGNLYVSGDNGQEDLGPGSGVILVQKFDRNLRRLWSTRLPAAGPATSYSMAMGIAVDRGKVFVAGGTGFFPTGWVGRLDAATGRVEQTRLLADAGALSFIFRAVPDADGHLYLAGAGSADVDTVPPIEAPSNGDDGLLFKLNEDDLSLVWAQRIGNKAFQESEGGVTYVRGSAPGRGTVALSGWTYGVISNPDEPEFFPTSELNTWTASYDADGNRRWITQDASSPQMEWPYDTTSDSAGNIYVTGWSGGAIDTTGTPNRGVGDLFVTKRAPDGTKLWTRTIGGAGQDEGWGVTIAPDGAVLVGGDTASSLDGSGRRPAHLEPDALVARLDPADGTLLAIRQFGATGWSQVHGLRVVGDTVYATGFTQGSLFAPNAGGYDGFLATLDARTLAVRPPAS